MPDRLSQEQPPVEDVTAFKEWLTRLVITINALLDAFFEDVQTIDGTGLTSYSTSSQNPSSTDTAFQIAFGGASDSDSKDCSIDANGTVTINIAGTYEFTTEYYIDRTATSGLTLLLFWHEVNSVAAATSSAVPLNGDDQIPLIKTIELELEVDDTVDFFMVRDSAGSNDGGLIPVTATGSFPDSPSAYLRVKRTILQED